MIYLLLLPIFVFTVVSILNSYFGPYLKNIDANLKEQPKVSVLIPAKNEKNRIYKCLDTISKQEYDNLEIIVLDDESDDGTFEYVKDNFPNVEIIKGKLRPEAWVGKNWACQQLADHSNGEILIFTDADNWFESDAVLKTITSINKYDLDMLSCFPENVTKSFYEKIYSTIVEHILYSLLPLWLTLKSKKTSLAAANGQWIAIKRKAYLEIGGHERLKNSNVEDILMARLIKSKSYKLLTLSGIGIIKTRMYSNFQEIKKGFSKNMYQMLGGNIFAFLLNLFLFWSTIFALFSGNVFVITLGFILLLVWKLNLSIKYNLNFIHITFFHPLILIFMTVIGIKSAFLQNKKMSWR